MIAYILQLFPKKDDQASIFNDPKDILADISLNADFELFSDMQDEVDMVFDDEKIEEQQKPVDSTFLMDDAFTPMRKFFSNNILTDGDMVRIFQSAVKLSEETQPELTNLPLALGMFLTPVDRRILPEWMQAEYVDSDSSQRSAASDLKMEFCHTLPDTQPKLTPFSLNLLYRSSSVDKEHSHKLCDAQNDKVVDYIMSLFNYQSHININFETGERHDGLPPHISLTMHLAKAYKEFGNSFAMQK